MTFDELLTFIRSEHNRLMTFYEFPDKNAMTFPTALKLGEEVGELYEKILAANQLQRKEKLPKVTEGLGHEFADVLIVTLLLAEGMGINIKDELVSKIEKIKSRNY